MVSCRCPVSVTTVSRRGFVNVPSMSRRCLVVSRGEIDSEIDSKINSDIDSGIDGEIDKAIDSEIHSETDTEIDSEVRTEIDSLREFVL